MKFYSFFCTSSPPCIPYVGLILQDLTFVHIGNSDTFDGKVNFAKRWQQFNILDNLRRFKKETYPFKRKDEIVNFFDEFRDFEVFNNIDIFDDLSTLVKKFFTFKKLRKSARSLGI